MSFAKTTAALWACAAAACAAAAPVPGEATMSALEKGVIAIVHFGPNTFTNREWGYGDTPASVFDPKRLDAAQWVAAAKAGGIRRIVLVCKHHDGFCLWPSAQNGDYTVANSPWRGGKGDLVREVRDATLAAGLEFGAYLSPWDRHHADYARPEYTEYFHRQWDELMRDYGPISEIWLDGANGGDGWYGGARETRKIPAAPIYYDHPRLLKALKERYPLAAIFGMDTDRTLRWPGNEKGTVPEGYDLVRNGVFQPPEADTPLRGKWFWHPNDRAKSLKELTDRYLESVGRSGILDLGLAPNRDGLLDEGDVRRLREFGEWVRLFNYFDAAEMAEHSAEQGENRSRFTVSLPLERHPGVQLLFDALDLSEDIAKDGLRVKSWKAYADGREIASGRQIGFRRITRLAFPVSVREVRVEVESDGKALVRIALRRVPSQDGSAMKGVAPVAKAIPYEVCRDADSGPSAFTVDFGLFVEVGGFSFTPGADLNALPKGYAALAQDTEGRWREVERGEFGNIQANPVRQDVVFARPVKARHLRLVAQAFPGGGTPRWDADGSKMAFFAPQGDGR